MKTLKDYTTPSFETLEVFVEHGFALSPGTEGHAGGDTGENEGGED